MNIKSLLQFNKQERRGIFYLLFLIVLLQGIYYLYTANDSTKAQELLENKAHQAQIDSLKLVLSKKDSVKIYPFNPNFITDYKGYALGMSSDEIDRLFKFREKNKFANSAEEFQEVTKISDSLLSKISPYFKFPEWTKKGRVVKSSVVKVKEVISVKDINKATAKDLQEVSGVGEVLSERIIKFKDRLGGFLDMAQLNQVYGLKPDVILQLGKQFAILQVPKINKVALNEASANELLVYGYIDWKLANEIIKYRDTNGAFTTFKELLNVPTFPKDKLPIIQLYLSVN